MRRPIAQRPVTGARRVPGRRRPSAGHSPQRRPLALLYRRPQEAGTSAPAAVRAADGRAVPLAPRLQIALHLSIALREQHHVHAAPVEHIIREHGNRVDRHGRFVPARTAFRERPLRDGVAAARAARRGRDRDISAWAASGRPLFGAAQQGRDWSAAASPSTVVSGLGAAAELRCRLRPSHNITRHTSRTAFRTRTAGSAGERPGEAAPRLISAHRTRDRFGQLALRRAASEASSTPGARAARNAPPLHWARPSSAAPTAPGPTDPALRPPPLDYRRPTPPAPPVQAEAWPAATTAPSAPPIDLEAVSRDVIRRIEQRLRVERERRGRS